MKGCGKLKAEQPQLLYTACGPSRQPAGPTHTHPHNHLNGLRNKVCGVLECTIWLVFQAERASAEVNSGHARLTRNARAPSQAFLSYLLFGRELRGRGRESGCRYLAYLVNSASGHPFQLRLSPRRSV